MGRARKRTWRSIALLAVLATVAAACGGDDGGGGGGDSAGGGAVRPGGEMTIVTQTDPRSLDPALNVNANSTGGPVLSAIYGWLYRIDPDSGDFVPGIAESLETTDGGTTWELRLREGVQFSDGSPLDAEAVKFSWERMADPSLGSPSIDVASEIASMTVVDPTTLEIALRAPNPHWVQLIPFQPMEWIVPPTVVEERGEQFGNEPVGAGPFVLDSRTPNAQTVLTKNPNYWNEGRPYLDQLTITFNPDAQQALDTIVAGQASAFVNPTDLVADQAQDAGLDVTQYLTVGGVNYLINAQQPPFDDVRARQAVVLAVDPEVINETVFQGAIEVPNPLIPESSPLHDPSATLTEPDAEAAQDLFDELADEGNPVEFTVSATNTAESRAVAQAIVTQLRQFDNVSVDIEELDAATYAQRLFVEEDFQMINAGTISLDPEPTFYDWFHSTGSRNKIGLDDPAIDAALEAGRASTDEAERRAAYADFVEALNEQAPAIWIYRKYMSIAHAADTTGWDMYGGGTPIYDELGFTS